MVHDKICIMYVRRLLCAACNCMKLKSTVHCVLLNSYNHRNPPKIANLDGQRLLLVEKLAQR